MKRIKSISIFGLGYVGLSTAVCFASKGFKVLGVDIDRRKVDALRKGETYVYEPKLKSLLLKAMKNGCFHPMLDHKRAVTESEATFITVGTPSKEDGSADLRHVEESSRMIGSSLKDKESYHLVVVKSTVPPGTTNQLVKPTIEMASSKRCGSEWGLCMNPEFLREGSAIKDTLKPDRIIIGEYDKASGDVLEKLYEEFYDYKMPPLIRTNPANAELIKYANNAFLATKVSFINSVANLCQKIPNADVKVVAESIGLDRRIGHLFLNAGLGWGGSCFLKDLKALTAYAKGLHAELPVVEASMKVNEDQPLIAISLAHKLVGVLKKKRVSILGLSFKPNTDDMREAVSVKVINSLLKEGAYVVVHDPRALDNAKKIFGDKVRYEERVRDCLKDSECCIIVTEWDEYKALKPNDFQRYMKNPAVVDGRRIYDPEEFKLIKYATVGLGS